VEDMAKHAIYILEDEKRLLQFKANSLEQAKKFDIKKITPLYENLYKRVIEENKAK